MVVQWSLCCLILVLNNDPVARQGVCESVLASVLLDASSTFPQFLLHALSHTRWQSTIREQLAGASPIPLLYKFRDSESPRTSH